MQNYFIRLYSFAVLAYWCSTLYGQNNVRLEFVPEIKAEAIKTGDNFYYLSNGDSLQIEELKFYISGIKLLRNGAVVWEEPNSFHLVNNKDARHRFIDLQVPADKVYDKIIFNLGIDSSTNVSGAMGGDLDPSSGMYWTWQSGYINLKLEGRYSGFTSKSGIYEYHLGGYLWPNYAMQTVELPCSMSNSIRINMDMESFFSGIENKELTHIMSPSADAVLLSEKIKTIFSIAP